MPLCDSNFTTMKSKYLKCALAAVLFAGVSAVRADDALSAGKQAEIKTALTGVSLADAVKSSASLVSGAAEAERMPVTVAVLRTVARTHVTALSKAVAAIARSTPDMANVAASEAARLHPEEAVSIVREAAHVAPGQAGAIVEAVLFYSPAAFREVGEVALNEAPSQTRAILNAVAVNNLDLKPYFDNALAANANLSPSVAKDVLRHATLISKGDAKKLSVDLAGAQVVQNNSAYGYAKPLNTSGLNLNSPGAQVNAGSPLYLPGPIFFHVLYPPPPVPVVLSTAQTHQEAAGGRNYSPP